MQIIKRYLAPSTQIAFFLVLVTLYTLTLSGCDNLYDALKFGDGNAEAQDDLVGGNRVITRLVDLDNFGITVDDGALSPTLDEVVADATQLTMQSDGTVRFGESGTIEVQTGDIVIIRGSSQTGVVTIIRPSPSNPTPEQ
jgi:hypothetical protein